MLTQKDINIIEAEQEKIEKVRKWTSKALFHDSKSFTCKEYGKLSHDIYYGNRLSDKDFDKVFSVISSGLPEDSEGRFREILTKDFTYRYFNQFGQELKD